MKVRNGDELVDHSVPAFKMYLLPYPLWFEVSALTGMALAAWGGVKLAAPREES